MSQNKKPEISVVFPVYNGQTYLRQSLESVLTQTFELFELIIWNDASTDYSADIIAEYQDSRIRIFANSENRGLFPTLNAAIGKVQSHWIKLWTQDDVMKPQSLQKHWEFLQRYPDVAMCYCAVDTIDETGRIVRPAKPDPTPEIIAPDLSARIMFYHGSIAGNISNVTLNKEVLNEIGLFREDMKVSGDFEMWTRICQDHTIGRIAEPLVYLRAHAGQFSRQKSSLLAFMLEDLPIYEILMLRLPPTERHYAKRYHRMTRHRVYAHYLMRALQARDFKTVGEMYKVLRQIGSPLSLILLWLITINGRLFQVPSRYVIDNNSMK